MTVENPVVSRISAIALASLIPPSPRPSPWEGEGARLNALLVAGGGRVVERLEPCLEPALGDANSHGKREIQGARLRALGHYRVPHSPERLEGRFADRVVDPEVAAFGVEPRRLDGGLGPVPQIGHVRDHLGNGRDDL